jgi:K+-sensing histidine kinase KdpD
MGIGLSVSRSIIESHHGRLWAEQEDGPGALFCFCIPVNFAGMRTPTKGRRSYPLASCAIVMRI